MDGNDNRENDAALRLRKMLEAREASEKSEKDHAPAAKAERKREQGWLDSPVVQEKTGDSKHEPIEIRGKSNFVEAGGERREDSAADRTDGPASATDGVDRKEAADGNQVENGAGTWDVAVKVEDSKPPESDWLAHTASEVGKDRADLTEFERKRTLAENQAELADNLTHKLNDAHEAITEVPGKKEGPELPPNEIDLLNSAALAVSLGGELLVKQGHEVVKEVVKKVQETFEKFRKREDPEEQ